MSSFDDTVLETIEIVVRNVFGGDAAEIIFQYLSESGAEGPYDRLRIVSEILHKTVDSGAVIIEDLILDTLYSKYRQELAWNKDYTFTDYITELRKKLKERKLNETPLLVNS
jgi:hypothetical protein